MVKTLTGKGSVATPLPGSAPERLGRSDYALFNGTGPGGDSVMNQNFLKARELNLT